MGNIIRSGCVLIATEIDHKVYDGFECGKGCDGIVMSMIIARMRYACLHKVCDIIMFTIATAYLR